MATLRLIAYDVRNNNNRAKIAARLQVHGNRVQKSVFLLSLDDKELDELLAEVDGFLDHHHDRLVVVKQCQSCWQKVIWVGQATVEQEELCWTVM